MEGSRVHSVSGFSTPCDTTRQVGRVHGLLWEKQGSPRLRNSRATWAAVRGSEEGATPFAGKFPRVPDSGGVNAEKTQVSGGAGEIDLHPRGDRR